MGYSGRDIEICEIENDFLMITACDACAGIGEKELDVVSASADIVGQLTVRVPLMELLSVGVQPKMISIAIASEPDPTGRAILSGINRELREAGLSSIPKVISTEKNFSTTQTGLGISMTGACERNVLRVNQSQPGDFVYCVGVPKVGADLSQGGGPDVLTTKHVARIMQLPMLHDLIPVGSRGVRGELTHMIRYQKKVFRSMTHSLNMEKSGGPNTCAIITSETELTAEHVQNLPLTCLGTLY